MSGALLVSSTVLSPYDTFANFGAFRASEYSAKRRESPSRKFPIRVSGATWGDPVYISEISAKNRNDLTPFETEALRREEIQRIQGYHSQIITGPRHKPARERDAENPVSIPIVKSIPVSLRSSGLSSQRNFYFFSDEMRNFPTTPHTTVRSRSPSEIILSRSAARSGRAIGRSQSPSLVIPVGLRESQRRTPVLFDPFVSPDHGVTLRTQEYQVSLRQRSIESRLGANGSGRRQGKRAIPTGPRVSNIQSTLLRSELLESGIFGHSEVKGSFRSERRKAGRDRTRELGEMARRSEREQLTEKEKKELGNSKSKGREQPNEKMLEVMEKQQRKIHERSKDQKGNQKERQESSESQIQELSGLKLENQKRKLICSLSP